MISRGFMSAIAGLLVVICLLSDISSAFTALHPSLSPSSLRVTPTTRKNPSSTSSALSFLPRTSDLSSGKRESRLFMGWGPDPIWSEATIVSRSDACTNGACVSVVLNVPASAIAEYIIPGQYVQVRLNDAMEQVLFLAMASAPSPEAVAAASTSDDESSEPPSFEDTTFEFLIKKTDGNQWLTEAAAVGSALQVSQVLGNGFPMAEELDSLKYDFPTQNVLLFAVGSGIAPIKAAMESGQLQTGPNGGLGRTARLYYGVRTEDDLCFASKFSEWESDFGIEVVPVLSQPKSTTYIGRTGYVQNALEEDGIPIPRNCGALLCGMKGMAESVKSLLATAGVFEGRVLTNF